jgi:hypothetical protein
VTAEPLALDTWTFTLADDAAPERLARRKAWLNV